MTSIDSIRYGSRILVVVASLLGYCPGVSQAQSDPGKFLVGTETIGAVLIAHIESGERISMRVQNVEPDPHDPEGELSLYTVFINMKSESEWQNLCTPDVHGDAKAIPLAGYWDYTGNYVDSESVTFACTSGALAKCVRWGFKPWKEVSDYSARDLHQSCTRMVRADYCGNGTAHTQDGTPINVYDRAGIQKPDQLDFMEFESAWGPDGAVALSRTRWPDTLQKLRSECPDKLDKIYTEGAVTREASLNKFPHALLFNESIPR